MNISIYKDSTDNSGKVAQFDSVLKWIKKGSYKDRVGNLREMLEVYGKAQYNEAKKSLPSVTFAGVFSPTRSLSTCSEYSSLIVLDVDNLTQEQMDDLRDAFTVDKHILSYFCSPSGSGLKILVQVDSGKEDHYSAFESLRIYFEANYQVKLDPSGKDISRLCYLSSDPELYYNGQAVPFHVEVIQSVRERVYGDREIYSKGNVVTNDDLKIYAVCKQWAETYKPYVEGGRNTHIFTCACNLNRTGMSLENAILSIARDRVDLPVQEIKETVRKVYQNKKKEHNTVTIFDFEKEQDAMRGAMEMHSPADIIDQLAAAPSEGLIKSGFKVQDETFGGGKERGAVYAYIGREKTYKSVHAIKEACFLARSGTPVLYLNGEMSKRQFMQIVAQQQMGIPRVQFQHNLEDIKTWVDQNLKCLSVVTGKDFTYDKIIKSVDAIRQITGNDVAQVFVDGITHMDPLGRDEIPATLESSKILKEVAKGCNEGRMAAITVLIHTDASCKHWSRMPQNFVRGKGKVLANFDGHIGFSRFVVAGSNNEDWTDYKLRDDLYNIRIKDERLTGAESNVVMHLDINCSPSESGDNPAAYELDYTIVKKSRY